MRRQRDNHENRESDLRQRSGGVNDKLTYLLVGGGIGAVLALLFAPKSGTELRGDIADATRKGYDRTRDAAQQLGQKSGEYYETARTRAGEAYSAVNQRLRGGGNTDDAATQLGADNAGNQLANGIDTETA